MAKQTFTSGQTLTAAQMTTLQANDFNWTVSTQTANYTLVAADKGTREVMNMASAGTVTVPNATFDAGDIVWIHSIGSGAIRIAAGAGMTLNSSAGTAPTLAQWEGGVVYFTSASSSIFFRGGGSNTLSIDYLLVGGGGGGGNSDAAGLGGSGGGGGGGFRTATDLIAKGNTYTVTVGAGGSVPAAGTNQSGFNGTASSFIRSANGGGGGGGQSHRGQLGGSGGGGGHGSQVAGAGVSGEGNSGGAGGSQSGGGGGGSGGTGSAGSSSNGGNGGAGTANSYTGSSIGYSGGGGGTGNGTQGTGTDGGGAASKTGAGTSGTANRGGGGGAGGAGGSGAAGNGGSGRVVLQILTADLSKFTVTTTGSPTTGTNGSYTWYAYDSTGTFRID